MRILVVGASVQLGGLVRSLASLKLEVWVTRDAPRAGLGAARRASVWASDATRLVDLVRRERIETVVLLAGSGARLARSFSSAGFREPPLSHVGDLRRALARSGLRGAKLLALHLPEALPLPIAAGPPACQACGACCYSRRLRWVLLGEGDLERLGPERAERLTVEHQEGRFMRMVEGRCAALGVVDGGYACTIYEARPTPCRGFERGTPDCEKAQQVRWRVGRSAPPASSAILGWTPGVVHALLEQPAADDAARLALLGTGGALRGPRDLEAGPGEGAISLGTGLAGATGLATTAPGQALLLRLADAPGLLFAAPGAVAVARPPDVEAAAAALSAFAHTAGCASDAVFALVLPAPDRPDSAAPLVAALTAAGAGRVEPAETASVREALLARLAVDAPPTLRAV